MKRRGPLVPIPAGQLISGRPDPAGTGQQGRKQEMEKKPGGRGWRQELAERLLGKLATRQGMRRTLPQAQEDSCRKAGAGSRLDGEKDAGVIVNAMKAEIGTEPLAVIDYVDAVDMDTLEKVEKMQGTVLVAMAVYIGKTRLIDNFIVKELK